ncbi:MAG TPA: flagellar assembly protein FliW [Geminicoccaceae bacterium]
MLQVASPAAVSSPAPSACSAPRDALLTRFGPIVVDPARTIRIPQGLFGFGHRTRFVLADLPERDVPFKLLQSVDDPALGFLVLPLVGDAPVRRRDLELAARQSGIAPEALIGLAIVTLRATPGDLRCTLNLKAPILIDSERRLGMQHVLAKDDYDVRHPLRLDGAEAA